MKVQLIVVQGKPIGKTIPLAGPRFKIGRGENCQLRPNSEMVSREHAEFVVTADRVTVKDLGSRNGTVLNGKTIDREEPLSGGDLVQVGPLTFAVSIEGAPMGASRPKAGKPASLDEAQQDDIDSWLVADEANPTPDRPSGVYRGDTMTLETYQAAKSPKQARPAPAPAPAPRIEEPAESEIEDVEDEVEEDSVEVEEYFDESNPFHVKKSEPEPAAAAKPEMDSSAAADQILRRMMDRRRASK